MINFDQILLEIKKKNIIKRYLVLICALFISSLVFNLFLFPIDIVTGGTSGISIITNTVYGLEPSVVIFFSSLGFLILGALHLPKHKIIGATIATVVYPFFVDITANITNFIKIDTSDLFLTSIIVGVLYGISNGLIYKVGLTAGGIPIVNSILYKYFKIPISKSSLLINSIIVIIGGTIFGWTKVMYAIIILVINRIVSDKVLLGISTNKAFYIITSEEKKVNDYIIKELNHSVTIFDVKGAFLKKKRRVLLTVIPTREYFKVTEGIKQIDKNAFFVVTDSYQVEGGK